MEAGIEGAGAANSFGVSIRLPFEAGTSQFLTDDPKLVNFRYFFTRKVTFVKEAHAFVLLPGGFGTLDEAFELLTLVQTGKAPPAPIVLLDVPGGTYWTTWLQFVEAELRDRGYISPHDLELVKITDNVDVALEEITTFYRNYHSLRFVDGDLVLRMHTLPTDAGAGRAERRVRRHHHPRPDRARRTEQGRARRRRRARPGPPPLPLRPPRLRAPPLADRPAQRPLVDRPSVAASAAADHDGRGFGVERRTCRGSQAMTFTPIAPTTYVPPLQIADDTWVIHSVQPALGQPLFVYLNSMVILGAEPMIVDTGTIANREQWLKDVFSLVEPETCGGSSCRTTTSTTPGTSTRP